MHPALADLASRLRGRGLLVGALLLVVILSVTVVVLLSDRGSDGGAGEAGPAPDSAASPRIVAPEDGVLTVGTGSSAVRITQLAGTCSENEGGADQCSFGNEAPTVVESEPGSLALQAEKSKTLSVSVTSSSDPTKIPPVTLEDGNLVFEDAPPGEYTVAVLGDQQGRGVWRFVLKVL